MDGDDAVRILKALADETRFQMVKKIMLAGEMSCHDLHKNFDLSQPALSHHSNRLVNAGILRVRKDGVAHFYSIEKSFRNTIMNIFS